MNNIGALIKRHRKKAGLTQYQASERADVHEAAWCHWERGIRMPSVPNLAKIARALRLSGADIGRLVMRWES